VLIVGYACANQVSATGVAGAIFVDIALWVICAVTLSGVLRAARHRRLQLQRASALAVQFADWVEKERAHWNAQ